MPLASTMAYVKGLLDGTKCPGQSRFIRAYVAPPDPETNNREPHAYIWTSRGNERRATGPRGAAPANTRGQYVQTAPAGWKTLSHSIDIYLTWFDDNSDPQGDSTFPFVVDIVLAVLRTTQMPILITDPGTGQKSQLVTLGRDMSWEYMPIKATASQRMWRLDALITAPTEEWIQA